MDTTQEPRRLALVGLMGAGKSRVGLTLATGLGWPFHDADRMAEARAGRGIAEMFRVLGEAIFRDLEAQILAELAQTPPPFVVALGGGVVDRLENRTLLRRDFFVVWLDVTPEEAARRIGADPERPLLLGEDPGSILSALERRRRPCYEEVARLRLVTDPSTRPEDLQERILEALGSRFG